MRAGATTACPPGILPLSPPSVASASSSELAVVTAQATSASAGGPSIPAPAGDDAGAFQPPRGWCESRVELTDLLSPRGPPFILDDPAEASKWENFQATVGEAATSIGTSTRLLGSAAPMFKVRLAPCPTSLEPKF